MDGRGRVITGGTATSPESALASELFDQFVSATTFKSVLSTYRQLCEVLRLKPTNFSSFYPRLKAKLHSWRAASLWAKLDKRASHKCYNRGKACPNTRVLLIGAGPCGLRAAIEAQLLGAKVVVVEKRDRFSRNNVLHLWPFVIHDLRNLGAKKFFGKFCAGSIDHISIRQLQLILLKVALLLGVEVHENVSFVRLLEPPEDQKQEGIGWRAAVTPSDHPVSQYEFDVLIGADGKRNTLLGFNRKEFRGKLAIAVTANFINRHTLEEARVPEISGVAFIFNQKFFQDMREQTGIDLENIVYYKDDTHYFVMTAKKQSLLDRGVIINDYNDTARLLSAENVDREALMEYARDAAYFSTNFQLPSLDFAVNHYGQADVAMFDFTSMYAAENACRVTERRGHKLLQGLVGDSLLEPFWPTGSGCARGFLSSFDAAWMIRSWASGKLTPLQVLAEREAIYRLLAQTTPENLSKDLNQYTLSPASRYPNLNLQSVLPSQVRSLYDTDGKIDDLILDTPVEAPKKKRRRGSIIHPDALLNWCQRQVALHDKIKIENLTSSWKNGLALCAILHRYRPDLINLDALVPEDVAKNNQLAFDICEKELGIPPVMTGQEMAECEVPDKLTMVSYLAQIYETFRGEIPVVCRPSVKSSTDDRAVSPNRQSFGTPRSILTKIGNKLQNKKKYSFDRDSAKEKADSLKRGRHQPIFHKRRSREKDKGIALDLVSSDVSLTNFKSVLQPSVTASKESINSRAKWLEMKIREGSGLRCHAAEEAENSKQTTPLRADHGELNIKLIQEQLQKNGSSTNKNEKRSSCPKVGKLRKDEWNVKMLEEKICQQQKVVPKTTGAERSKIFQDIYMNKLRLMEAKLRAGGDLTPEEKARFEQFDSSLSKLSERLTKGNLSAGERGNNQVAAMTEHMSSIWDKKIGRKRDPLPPPPVEPHPEQVAQTGGSETCYFCKKRVYLMEKLSAEGLFFHRSCFKCEFCSTSLHLGNYAFDKDTVCGGKFYCRSHFRKHKPDHRWQEMMKRKQAFLSQTFDEQEKEKIYTTILANAEKALSPNKHKEETKEEVTVTDSPSVAPAVSEASQPPEAKKAKSPTLLQEPASIFGRDQTPERVEYENSVLDYSEEELLTSELEEEELTQKNLGPSQDFATSDDEYSDFSSDESESDEEAYAEELERSLTADETRKLAERWQQKYSAEHSLIDTDASSSDEGDGASDTEIGSEDGTSNDIDSDEEYAAERSDEDVSPENVKAEDKKPKAADDKGGDLMVQVPVIDLKEINQTTKEESSSSSESSASDKLSGSEKSDSGSDSGSEIESESEPEPEPLPPPQIPTIVIDESPPQDVDQDQEWTASSFMPSDAPSEAPDEATADGTASADSNGAAQVHAAEDTSQNVPPQLQEGVSVKSPETEGSGVTVSEKDSAETVTPSPAAEETSFPGFQEELHSVENATGSDIVENDVQNLSKVPQQLSKSASDESRQDSKTLKAVDDAVALRSFETASVCVPSSNTADNTLSNNIPSPTNVASKLHAETNLSDSSSVSRGGDGDGVCDVGGGDVELVSEPFVKDKETECSDIPCKAHVPEAYPSTLDSSLPLASRHDVHGAHGNEMPSDSRSSQRFEENVPFADSESDKDMKISIPETKGTASAFSITSELNSNAADFAEISNVESLVVCADNSVISMDKTDELSHFRGTANTEHAAISDIAKTETVSPPDYTLVNTSSFGASVPVSTLPASSYSAAPTTAVDVVAKLPVVSQNAPSNITVSDSGTVAVVSIDSAVISSTVDDMTRSSAGVNSASVTQVQPSPALPFDPVYVTVRRKKENVQNESFNWDSDNSVSLPWFCNDSEDFGVDFKSALSPDEINVRLSLNSEEKTTDQAAPPQVSKLSSSGEARRTPPKTLDLVKSSDDSLSDYFTPSANFSSTPIRQQNYESVTGKTGLLTPISENGVKPLPHSEATEGKETRRTDSSGVKAVPAQKDSSFSTPLHSVRTLKEMDKETTRCASSPNLTDKPSSPVDKSRDASFSENRSSSTTGSANKSGKYHGYSGSFAEKIRPKSSLGDTIYLRSLDINLHKQQFPSLTKSSDKLDELNPDDKIRKKLFHGSDKSLCHTSETMDSAASLSNKGFKRQTSVPLDNAMQIKSTGSSVSPTAASGNKNVPAAQPKTVTLIDNSKSSEKELVANRPNSVNAFPVKMRPKCDMDLTKLSEKREKRKSLHENIQGLPFADEEKAVTPSEPPSTPGSVFNVSVIGSVPGGAETPAKSQCVKDKEHQAQSSKTMAQEQARKEARARARLKSDEELGLSPKNYRKKYQRQLSLSSIYYEELTNDEFYDHENEELEDEIIDGTFHAKRVEIVEAHSDLSDVDRLSLGRASVRSSADSLDSKHSVVCVTATQNKTADSVPPVLTPKATDEKPTTLVVAPTSEQPSVSSSDATPESVLAKEPPPMPCAAQSAPVSKTSPKKEASLQADSSVEEEKVKSGNKKHFFSILNFGKSHITKEKADKMSKNKTKDADKEKSSSLPTDVSAKAPSKQKPFSHLKLNRSREKPKERHRHKNVLPNVPEPSPTGETFGATGSAPQTITVPHQRKEEPKSILMNAEQARIVPKYTVYRNPGLQLTAIPSHVHADKVENGLAPKASEDSFSDTEDEAQKAGVPRSTHLPAADLKDKELDEKERKAQRIVQKVQKQQELKRLRTAQEIQRRLEELEVQQKELEQRGVEVEKALRGEGVRPGTENDHEQEWYRLVHTKNQLAREEQELLIRLKDLELENRHSRLQQEFMERMAQSAIQKNPTQISEEKKILTEMLQIVEERDELVAMLDQLRLKEEEEDRNIGPPLRYQAAASTSKT